MMSTSKVLLLLKNPDPMIAERDSSYMTGQWAFIKGEACEIAYTR